MATIAEIPAAPEGATIPTTDDRPLKVG